MAWRPREEGFQAESRSVGRRSSKPWRWTGRGLPRAGLGCKRLLGDRGKAKFRPMNRR